MRGHNYALRTVGFAQRQGIVGPAQRNFLLVSCLVDIVSRSGRPAAGIRELAALLLPVATTGESEVATALTAPVLWLVCSGVRHDGALPLTQNFASARLFRFRLEHTDSFIRCLFIIGGAARIERRICMNIKS